MYVIKVKLKFGFRKYEGFEEKLLIIRSKARRICMGEIFFFKNVYKVFLYFFG